MPVKPRVGIFYVREGDMIFVKGVTIIVQLLSPWALTGTSVTPKQHFKAEHPSFVCVNFTPFDIQKWVGGPNMMKWGLSYQ